MGWFRATAILVMAGILAVFSGLVALGEVTESRNPAISAALPLASGFALANKAKLLIAATVDPKEPSRFLEKNVTRRQVVSLSRDAYAKEPLAALALRNLALAADAGGNLPRARLLMRNAQRITRRSASVNTWLIRDFARQEDFAGTLRSYDFSLRSSLTARRELLPPLLDALAYPQMKQPLLSLLRKRPAWEEDFWAEAFKHEGALVNLAEIRIARAGDNYTGNESYDRSLINALIDIGKFLSADKLYRALTHKSAASGIVNSSSFDQPDLYPPFDWQIYFDDAMTADLLPDAGIFRISVFRNGEGRIARQLIALPADHYVLSAELSQMDKLSKHTLYARLSCADGPRNATSTVKIDIDRAALSVPFQKPNSNCVYHWLELVVRPPEGESDVALQLESLSIHPQG